MESATDALISATAKGTKRSLRDETEAKDMFVVLEPLLQVSQSEPVSAIRRLPKKR